MASNIFTVILITAWYIIYKTIKRCDFTLNKYRKTMDHTSFSLNIFPFAIARGQSKAKMQHAPSHIQVSNCMLNSVESTE